MPAHRQAGFPRAWQPSAAVRSGRGTGSSRRDKGRRSWHSPRFRAATRLVGLADGGPRHEVGGHIGGNDFGVHGAGAHQGRRAEGEERELLIDRPRYLWYSSCQPCREGPARKGCTRGCPADQAGPRGERLNPWHCCHPSRSRACRRTIRSSSCATAECGRCPDRTWRSHCFGVAHIHSLV